MKKILVISSIFILLFSINSCLPRERRVYVKNASSHNVYIVTTPPIENRLNLKNENKELYDSIVFFKQNNANEYGIYKLEPNQKIVLYRMIGIGGNFKTDPYKSIKIIKGNDTITVNKDNFMQKINKKVRNFYYIEVF